MSKTDTQKLEAEALAFLGRGLYTVPEAARLSRVSAGRIRRWMRGYTFRSSDGSSHASPPVVLAPGRQDAGGLTLTFRDLIEVRFIDAFRSHGVSWKVIRLSAERASELYRESHPFASQRFLTDGRSIFAEMLESNGEDSLLELVESQYAFKRVLEPYLYKGLEFSSADQVLRWWPLGEKRRVVIDPARAFGQPIDSSGFVPTAALAGAFHAEKSYRRVAEWFGVELRSVRDAVAFEQSLAA